MKLSRWSSVLGIPAVLANVDAMHVGNRAGCPL
jgi:hypothetical protein